MKKVTIVLLSIAFVTLISNSVVVCFADHLEPGIGMFRDQNSVNFIKTVNPDSKYEIYLQVVVRNAEEQLITVSEIDAGNYIPHEITDHVFDEMLGEKEIVIINNIKYEKVFHVIIPDTHDTHDTHTPVQKSGEMDYIGKWAIVLCGEIPGHGSKCLPVFQGFSAPIHVSETDVVTINWTILREIK